MQKDFHYAATYVLSRTAGFTHEDSTIIATSAQYVDDSIISGIIHFDNGARYQRISSAHKMIDVLNLDNNENHLVWLPFHFLPGNGGLGSGNNPDGKFIRKIICRPDSPVAHDMLAAAFTDKGKKRALHRLGIAMHVYADTWAHQGFAGVLHPVNDVEDISEPEPSGVFPKGLAGFLKELISDIAPEIGHGEANVLPDLPFLKWSYKNSLGERIERDNTAFFSEAAVCMHRELFSYRNPDAAVIPPIPAADLQLIKNLFISLRDTDMNKRFDQWAECIREGKFSFGPQEISYRADGPGSWKAIALETSEDKSVYAYHAEFLDSDWKMFHDALQAHRFAVLHDILPRYGICAG